MDIVPILSTIILIATIMTLIIAVSSYIMFRMKEKRKGQFKTSETTESSIVAGSSLSPELKEIQDLQRGVGTPTLQPVPKISGSPAPVVVVGNAPSLPTNKPNVPSGPPPAMGKVPQVPSGQPAPQPAPTVVNVNYPGQPAPSAPAPSVPPQQPQQPTVTPQAPAAPPPQQPAQQPAQQAPQYSKAQSSFMNSLKASGVDSTPSQNDQQAGQQQQANQGQSSFKLFQVPPQNQPAPDQPPPKSNKDEALWK